MSLAAVGCSVGNGESSLNEPLVSSSVDIVGGTVSTAAQDATVMLASRNQPICTGTLIAPNLVLTAHHCVAQPRGNTECSPFGTPMQANSISIVLGVNARANGPAAAMGAKIVVPQTSNMCSFDVALIQLDREISGAKIAKVRFSALANNEPVVAVGYGVDGRDNDLPQRMQRSTTVLGVGARVIQYTTKQNIKFNYNLPIGDVATGESTCYGDSGGPLFDAQGNVVAITSRGPEDYPQGSAHGNGCIDLPSIYAGATFNEAFIRETARAAGHPLEVAPAEEEDNTPIDPRDTDDPIDEDDDVDDRDDEEEDEDAESDDAKTTKKKTRRIVVHANSACSFAPPFASKTGWLSAVGIALALAFVRRRRMSR